MDVSHVSLFSHVLNVLCQIWTEMRHSQLFIHLSLTSSRVVTLPSPTQVHLLSFLLAQHLYLLIVISVH